MRQLALAAFMLSAACASGAEEAAIGETGGMCGGIAGFECAEGRDYCAMERTACTRISDAAGICTPKPQACTMEYSPVCGCDGETYPNACAAASNGVSISNDGECAE